MNRVDSLVKNQRTQNQIAIHYNYFPQPSLEKQTNTVNDLDEFYEFDELDELDKKQWLLDLVSGIDSPYQVKEKHLENSVKLYSFQNDSIQPVSAQMSTVNPSSPFIVAGCAAAVGAAAVSAAGAADAAGAAGAAGRITGQFDRIVRNSNTKHASLHVLESLITPKREELTSLIITGVSGFITVITQTVQKYWTTYLNMGSSDSSRRRYKFKKNLSSQIKNKPTPSFTKHDNEIDSIYIAKEVCNTLQAIESYNKKTGFEHYIYKKNRPTSKSVYRRVKDESVITLTELESTSNLLFSQLKDERYVSGELSSVDYRLESVLLSKGERFTVQLMNNLALKCYASKIDIAYAHYLNVLKNFSYHSNDDALKTNILAALGHKSNVIKEAAIAILEGWHYASKNELTQIIALLENVDTEHVEWLNEYKHMVINDLKDEAGA